MKLFLLIQTNFLWRERFAFSKISFRTRTGFVVERKQRDRRRNNVRSEMNFISLDENQIFFSIHFSSHKSNEENILAGDQYESLWSDFLASLQRENAESVDEPATSVATTTEDDDNEDDPEFRLPETELELDDDLDEELHVSSRTEKTPRTFFFFLRFAFYRHNETLFHYESIRNSREKRILMKRKSCGFYYFK